MVMIRCQILSIWHQNEADIMLMCNVITLQAAYFASILSCLLFLDPHSCTRCLKQEIQRKLLENERRKDDGSVRQGTQLKPSCIVHISGQHDGQLHVLLTSQDADGKLAGLKEICKSRLFQPLGSIDQMIETCKLIPDVITENSGYHRECYQRFTIRQWKATCCSKFKYL